MVLTVLNSTLTSSLAAARNQPTDLYGLQIQQWFSDNSRAMEFLAKVGKQPHKHGVPPRLYGAGCSTGMQVEAEVAAHFRNLTPIPASGGAPQPSRDVPLKQK
jgi:hypothetical protein